MTSRRRSQGKRPGMVGLLRVGYCATCHKHAYGSKRDATRVYQSLYADGQNSVYRCPANDKHWHYGRSSL